MWFVFPFYLLVTSGYLDITCFYLVVTSGYLIATTGYFWLLPITSCYFWFLILVTTSHIEISTLPPLISTFLLSAMPQNMALIRIFTTFYEKLNQNAYGTSMQTIKQWKYCWYLDFFIIFGLLIVKIYVSFLFWNEKWQGLTFTIVHFCNFEITTATHKLKI